MVSRKLLAGLFVREYWLQLMVLPLLVALSYYAILYGKLFEFLVLVVMWIQLEVAYRQWWLEAEGKRPPLIVKLELVGDDNIALLVRNTSALPIYEINTLVLPYEVYRRYSTLLVYNVRVIKYLYSIGELTPCVMPAQIDLFPDEEKIVSFTFKELKEGCHDVGGIEDAVALIICHDDPTTYPESCGVIARLSIRSKTAYVRGLFRGVPGILTRIPNMIRDAYIYHRYHKLLKTRSRSAQYTKKLKL
jgi:hypothetical protein